MITDPFELWVKAECGLRLWLYMKSLPRLIIGIVWEKFAHKEQGQLFKFKKLI